MTLEEDPSLYEYYGGKGVILDVVPCTTMILLCSIVGFFGNMNLVVAVIKNK